MIRNVIVKVTLDCNIACKYCYVRRNRARKHPNQVMGERTLTALIRKLGEYLQSHPQLDRFVLYWHGGEPLMAGRDFFLKCNALQERYLPSNRHVVNTIQTNGILLNDPWASTIRRIGFGVCVSIDGPPEINDIWRRTYDNRGTHRLIVRGIEALKRNGIPLSILSVITPQALPHGARIYQMLRDLGCEWMDLMYPFYSLIDNTLDMEVQPGDWGEFLIDVFDAWMEEGNPAVTVRLLEDLCMLVLGGRTQMCVSGTDCSYVITVNPNGDVLICDDLLAYADSYLGNIHHDSIDTLSQNPRLTKLKRMDVLYGDECLSCDVFSLCRGGCTLFRARGMNDFSGRHYFCESQRRIIGHVQGFFKAKYSLRGRNHHSHQSGREFLASQAPRDACMKLDCERDGILCEKPGN
jgi:uncharacterized protein